MSKHITSFYRNNITIEYIVPPASIEAALFAFSIGILSAFIHRSSKSISCESLNGGAGVFDSSNSRTASNSTNR